MRHAFRPAVVARLLLPAIVCALSPVGSASCAEKVVGESTRPAAESSANPASLKFELDVMPILTAAGCNSGPCHGKQRGQNGFQLSLLGFDHDFDFGAIAVEARGRRVSPTAPERSLLLEKATGQQSHGGGKRFDVGSPSYEILRRWIAGGMPRAGENDPKFLGIELQPKDVLLQPKAQQQIRVTAKYSDGSSRDVTSLTTYQSNDAAVTAVNEAGLLTAGKLPGETAVMARYMNQIGVVHIAVPQTGTVDKAAYAKLPRSNFIDDLVWKRLERLGIMPSGGIDDATFLRRAYLDVIGRLPTPDEVRTFLADKSATKREQLVDALLERPEYADFWANKWADLLRPNPYRVGMKSVMSFDAWIRDSFRQNKPYDQFVRELVTAKGSTWRNGAAVMFRDRRSAEEITTMVAQLFLGVRLDCARCHHHPFEVWGQDEFYGTAAYFARVGYKGTGVSPPISGGEEFIYARNGGPGVKHPLTGQEVTPKPLTQKLEDVVTSDTEIENDRESTNFDRRDAFFAWMVDEKNPYFAQVAVNRVWADVMGRGIVEPVDDMRATNPPTNPELLAALAADFRKQKFDVKKLLRTILTSQVYQLSAIPNERNSWDSKNFSRHYRQQLRAEVLLDAVCDITGQVENFSGAMPPESRAMELWTHRVESMFLDAFGRPDLNQDPPCERQPDSTLVQAMHLMNAPRLHAKVTGDDSRPAKLVKADKTPEQIVEDLYLYVYSRLPTDAERKNAADIFSADPSKHRETAEDLLWALLNTPEFLFKN
jgi:hypothetical protein